MTRLLAQFLLLLAACAPRGPHAYAAVSPGGASGPVRAGAVAVATGPGGALASAHVVDSDRTDVTLKTQDATVPLQPGVGSVRRDIANGGFGIGS